MCSVLHLCGIIRIVSVVYCKRIAQLWMMWKLGVTDLQEKASAACPHLLAVWHCPHKFKLGYFATQSRVKSFLDRCLVVRDRPKASLCAHMCRVALAELAKEAGVGPEGHPGGQVISSGGSASSCGRSLDGYTRIARIKRSENKGKEKANTNTI